MLPVALAIAGSDSSGAAGLQADLATFTALGVHGAAALTMVTAQNGHGIHRAFPIPPDMVVAQIDAVLDDLPVRAVKTGLLGNAPTIDAVGEVLAARPHGHLVVDPVLVDGLDRRLVDDDGLDAYRRLMATATVITPNRAEAALLLGRPVGALAAVPAVEDAAADLAAIGPRAVLVTGGRDGGADAVDVLIVDGTATVLREPRIVAGTPRTDPGPTAAKFRGSGCTLAAAVTALLARGTTVTDAIGGARRVVRARLLAAADAPMGSGRPGVVHVVAPGMGGSGEPG